METLDWKKYAFDEVKIKEDLVYTSDSWTWVVSIISLIHSLKGDICPDKCGNPHASFHDQELVYKL